ncbi:hypothetical protein [Mycobacterium sp. 050134]|uniref:hypothetical protein n=1 Tax=Mycobacterium sp. 050134 TaxID=3096111 RepID=UPI002ED8ED68
MPNFSFRVRFEGYVDYQVAQPQTFMSAVGIDQSIPIEQVSPELAAQELERLLKEHTERVHAALFDFRKYQVGGVNVSSPKVTTMSVERGPGFQIP